MEMSGRLLGQFSKNLSGKLWDITKAAPGKTLDMGIKAGINTGHALADGVTLVGSGISSGVSKLAEETAKTVQGTVSSVKNTAMHAVETGLHHVADAARHLRKPTPKSSEKADETAKRKGGKK